MTTPKRPRTILAVEAELQAAALNSGVRPVAKLPYMLSKAVSLLADANREIEKLEAERAKLRARLESMENIAMEQGR